MPEKRKPTVGQKMTIRTMRWDDGWEFDCPVVILSPVVRVAEDGRSMDQLVEDFLIDCCVTGIPASEKLWRWPLDYLKRKFYRVEHQTVEVEFVLDEDKQLSWRELRKRHSAT